MLGTHRVTEELNLTNQHRTDVGDLPSSRWNYDERRLMVGVRDTAVLGDPGHPSLVNAYVQFRGEPSNLRPAHLEFGTPSSFVNLFSSTTTGEIFGDVTQTSIGPGFSPYEQDEQYASWGINLTRQASVHSVKVGWDGQRTRVNGPAPDNIFDAIFATVADFDEVRPHELRGPRGVRVRSCDTR